MSGNNLLIVSFLIVLTLINFKSILKSIILLIILIKISGKKAKREIKIFIIKIRRFMRKSLMEEDLGIGI